MIHTLKESIEITQVSLIQTADIVASSATLFQISAGGFWLKVYRKDLPQSLKNHISLNALCNKEVDMLLPMMNIHLDGVVIKTKYFQGGVFEIFIRFLDNIPRYWYDCLMDILISYPYGEFSNLELMSSYKTDG